MSRNCFEDSRKLKLPTHKFLPTHIHMWTRKQYCSYRSAKYKALIRIFTCPMINLSDCPCLFKTIESTKSLELYFLGEHDEQCLAMDKSAYLKVKQIVALLTESGLPPSSPRQSFVRTWRCELLPVLRKQLIPSCFAPSSIMSKRFDRNSHCNDLLDLQSKTHMVIFCCFCLKMTGTDNINNSSLWWLLNAFCALNTGWVFQLNANAIFNFCRRKVDMIGFGVNSLGGHNHPLCWLLIPYRAEGELAYTTSYTAPRDLQRAAMCSAAPGRHQALQTA
jgi:hypothetical protein